MGCINGETHGETPKESPTRQPAESSVLVGKGKSVIRWKLCLWTKEIGHKRIHGDHGRFDTSAAAKMTKAKRIFKGTEKTNLLTAGTPSNGGTFRHLRHS